MECNCIKPCEECTCCFEDELGTLLDVSSTELPKGDSIVIDTDNIPSKKTIKESK